MAGALRRRRRQQMAPPHTQIGQNGKGSGVPKPPPTGAPSVLPNVGGMPKLPPTPPNFLPMTPGFERSQRGANDALTAAEGQYAVSSGLVAPQLNLQQQRLKTDMGVAANRLDENLAERGVFSGGIRPQMYDREIATPFGRQFQDLALGAAGQYADIANQYGGAQLGYNQQIMDALQQRAADVYQAQPLGMPIGGYQLPHLPTPTFQYPATAPKPAGRRRRRSDGRKPRGRK